MRFPYICVLWSRTCVNIVFVLIWCDIVRSSTWFSYSLLVECRQHLMFLKLKDPKNTRISKKLELHRAISSSLASLSVIGRILFRLSGLKFSDPRKWRKPLSYKVTWGRLYRLEFGWSMDQTLWLQPYEFGYYLAF